MVTRDAGLAALVPEGRGFGAKGEATTRPLLLPQDGVRFAPRPFVRHFLVKKKRSFAKTGSGQTSEPTENK